MKHILCGVAIGLITALSVTTIPAQAQDTLPAGNAEAGAIVFKKCLVCHKVGPDATNGVGPLLNDVVDRPAGTFAGYNYSAAMRNSGLVWDEPTLTTYLHGPRKLVPGTKMTFPGLPKDQDIADVIAYLKGFKADGQPATP
jgi:cytochrome c